MLDGMIQLPWLAQSNSEEWVNILFIVAVAVFWAVGGLLKAASARKTAASQGRRPGRQKRVDEEEQQTWQQRLTRKAEEIQRAAHEHLRKMQEQTGQAASSGQPRERHRPDQGRITVRSRPGGEPVLVYERGETPQQKHQRAARLAQERQEEARRLRQQRLQAAEKRLRVETPSIQAEPDAVSNVTTATEEIPEMAHAASGLIDNTDADALRRAILHYEILGKPLSLRDPFEQQIPGL